MTTNEPNPNRLTRDAMIARVSDLVTEMMSIFESDAYSELVNEIIMDEHPDVIEQLDEEGLAGLQTDVEARMASALFFELHRLLFMR